MAQNANEDDALWARRCKREKLVSAIFLFENFPKTLSERGILWNMFNISRFGHIVGMKIECDERGSFLWFCLLDVHFEQEANAKTAMATLHIANFYGKKIVVKQFKSKKQHLEEQRRQVDVRNIHNLSRNTSN